MADAATGPLLPPGTELLYGPRDVQAALQGMAAQIDPFLGAGDGVLLAVMVGGMLPAARLALLLQADFVMDYCHVTRYRGGLTGGVPEWRQPPLTALAGKDVVIVDDIFDKGVTLDWVRRACLERGARRIMSAVLVRKRRQLERPGGGPDVAGLEVPDRYVFGCGMDLHERWRHLDAIYALPSGGLE